MHFEGDPACEVGYACPSLRWLYVAAQGDVSHAQVYDQLAAFAREGNALGSGAQQQSLVVMSIGIGPGVDVLGALDWIYDHTPYPNVAYVSVIGADRQTGWMEVGNEILDVFLRSPMRTPRGDCMEVRYTFGDLRDLAKQLPHADLLLCSWFWTEFMDDHSLALRYWQAIRERLSPGCSVLFAERSGAATKSLLEELLAATPGLNPVHTAGTTKATLDYSLRHKEMCGPFRNIETQSYRFRIL
jgi:hypothetical protein